MSTSSLYVVIHKEKVRIEKEVFQLLLDCSHLITSVEYKKAVTSKEINFEELKALATKAGVPYPLFFAPIVAVKRQVERNDKFLFSKISGKQEAQLSSRGTLIINDIKVLINDLTRKQEFLKRILPDTPFNTIIGCIRKEINLALAPSQLADIIRNKLNIDLNKFRSLTKDKAFSYLVDCIESNNILVSLSSHNFMPQNLGRDTPFSGICLKDKKFPYIFIHTRDGDINPKILESTGRQIFTLIQMLVCIAMNRFTINSKNLERNGKIEQSTIIAGEVLIMPEDIRNLEIESLKDLKEKAHFFRVTPSMLLYQLIQYEKISQQLAIKFRQMLAIEIQQAKPKGMSAILPKNGYAKCNGKRLSSEVIYAYKNGKIESIELKNILFRKGKKMDINLLQDYTALFS
jgi:hypothetical protein